MGTPQDRAQLAPAESNLAVEQLEKPGPALKRGAPALVRRGADAQICSRICSTSPLGSTLGIIAKPSLSIASRKVNGIRPFALAPGEHGVCQHRFLLSPFFPSRYYFLGLPECCEVNDGRRDPPRLVLGPGRKVLRGRGFSSALGFGGRALATKGTAASFSGVICSIDRPLTCTKLSSRAASRAFTASLTRERATNFPKKDSNSVCSAAITQSRYFDNSAESACCTDRFTPSRTASGDQRFSSSQYDPSGAL